MMTTAEVRNEIERQHYQLSYEISLYFVLTYYTCTFSFMASLGRVVQSVGDIHVHPELRNEKLIDPFMPCLDVHECKVYRAY